MAERGTEMELGFVSGGSLRAPVLAERDRANAEIGGRPVSAKVDRLVVRVGCRIELGGLVEKVGCEPGGREDAESEGAW